MTRRRMPESLGMPTPVQPAAPQVDANAVVASLQAQIAEQALRIALLEARLSAALSAVATPEAAL